MARTTRGGTTLTREEPHAGTMKALVWKGPGRVEVAPCARPALANARDAIVRVTSTTLGGSDLHLYHGRIPSMREGDILGHECMGIVEEVGSGVKERRPGDRVVVSAVVADGECWYCMEGRYSQCETTNAGRVMDALYGQASAGLFGHSLFAGGYAGGQAELIRVPYADVNLLPVPDTLRDERVLGLSEVVCAGEHAAVLGGVKAGHTVAVWGCGPVGLMAQAAAARRGAHVLAIDCVPERLDAARRLGAQPLDFTERDILPALHDLTQGRGPDVCVEAVGLRAAKAPRHSLGPAGLAGDSLGALDECVRACRKGGTVAILGDFVARADGFPTGAVLEKGLTLSAGQVPVQRYWRAMLDVIEQGGLDASFLLTHRMSLDRAPDAYELLDAKRDGVLKVLLEP